MAGSALGPLGALGGGILGGLAGAFSGDNGAQGYQDTLKQLAGQYGNREAPQAGLAAQAGYSGFRGAQAGLIAQLQSMAAGNGPSAAAIQMRQAMDRAAAAQASAAAGAGGRGVNAGAAMRTAMNNTAALQSQNARDTAIMRAQEQLAATGMLGNTINQGRNSDENVNQFNASQTNQTALANLQAKLQTMGMDQQGQLQALALAMGVAGPGLGSQIMAGGASAMPGILQYLSGKKGGAPSGGANPVAGTILDPNQWGTSTDNPYGWTPDHG